MKESKIPQIKCDMKDKNPREFWARLHYGVVQTATLKSGFMFTFCLN